MVEVHNGQKPYKIAVSTILNFQIEESQFTDMKPDTSTIFLNESLRSTLIKSQHNIFLPSTTQNTHNISVVIRISRYTVFKMT